MKKYLSRRKKKTILTALILGLCFGVSGHASAADASGFETPEYFKSTGLYIINASKAYAKGYTGKGVTVGISDEPVNFTSPEFSTKQITTPVPDFYPVYEDWEGNVYTVEDAEYWGLVDHGTHVAGTIAASRNELGMHGVAFDAEMLSSTHIEKVYPYGDDDREDWPDAFFNSPVVKTVNCSWGQDNYMADFVRDGETMEDYLWRVNINSRDRLALFNSVADKGKLFILAAGNTGSELPSVDAGSQWSVGKNTSLGVITVTALEHTDNLKQADGGIQGNNIMAWMSNTAAFNEDAVIAAPGFQIVSANASYANDGEIDREATGTSMAAPHVTGAAALVQQAYPWMTAKQIGDVLLSTANQNITSRNGYTVIASLGTATGIKRLDLYYFDGRQRTLDEQRKDCKDYLYSVMSEEEADSYLTKRYPICAHYNVPMEVLTGQGILDAGKAVDGPGALNARRLEAADISNEYTVGGKAVSQALYKVDTQGYDSTWANDIKEIRAGLLAADSSEEDLKRRYEYYQSNWVENPGFDSGARVYGGPFTKAYIDFYNDNATASGLVDLSVGLLKTGNGRLNLTGNNTYKGASIAQQGTLSVDGSIAGDATFQRGSHDKDWSCGITVKRMW